MAGSLNQRVATGGDWGGTRQPTGSLEQQRTLRGTPTIVRPPTENLSTDLMDALDGTPTSSGDTVASRYEFDFTNADTVVIPGTVHKRHTKYLFLEYWDSNGNILGKTHTIDPTTFDVTIRFLSPLTGGGVII